MLCINEIISLAPDTISPFAGIICMKEILDLSWMETSDQFINYGRSASKD